MNAFGSPDFEAGLFFDRQHGLRRNVFLWVSNDGVAGFYRVPELDVVSGLRNLEPSVLFQSANDGFNVHV